mgnify:CR=1 FL=1
MKIVLLVKQVPETGSVRLDETTGTVIRKAADAAAKSDAENWLGRRW